MQNDLDQFFGNVKTLCQWYQQETGKKPKRLLINPDILASKARIEGFFQRPEVSGAGVTSYAPMVRYLKFDEFVIEIVEAPYETFLTIE